MTEGSVERSRSSQSTSPSLLERARANDQLAWAQLVELYSSLVDHWSRKAGLQDADMADVRQEVFVAVARKIQDFRREKATDSFRGWLCRITQNKLTDHWRRKRGQEGAGDQQAQKTLDQVPAAAASDSDRATTEELQILYRRALELIARDFEDSSWQAFWQVVIEGRSPKDVAVGLQLTVNSVYLAKGRVLARLREEFAGAIED